MYLLPRSCDLVLRRFCMLLCVGDDLCALCVCVCVLRSVRYVDLTSNAHATKKTETYATKEWGVKKLTLQSSSAIHSLQRLPEYKPGRVQVFCKDDQLDLLADEDVSTRTHTRTDRHTFLLQAHKTHNVG